MPPRASAGFSLGGSVPPCCLGRFDYEMVLSEVYLNKYVVSIEPFSTPAFTPPIQKNCFFACFRFLIFHQFFQGGQLTPFALCSDADRCHPVTKRSVCGSDVAMLLISLATCFRCELQCFAVTVTECSDLCVRLSRITSADDVACFHHHHRRRRDLCFMAGTPEQP